MAVFIKVYHEEPIDKLSIDSIRGGKSEICNSVFTCEKYSLDGGKSCVCNKIDGFSCSLYTPKEPEKTKCEQYA
jgi:hypothetical protein